MDELVMHKGCEDVENIADARFVLAQDTGISHVYVHTKGYVVSAVAKGFIEPDDELDALFSVPEKQHYLRAGASWMFPMHQNV